MEPRAFTEAEKKSLQFFFDRVEVYRNYALMEWRGKGYVIAPIADSFEFACTSDDVLLTGYSFSEIKDQLVAGDVVSE